MRFAQPTLPCFFFLRLARSWAAEALCRSGVGSLVLIDLDDVCVSNTNRQLHALSTTVGQMKIDVMRERLLQINPFCRVHLVHDFVTADTVDDIFANINAQWTAGGGAGGRRPVTAVLDATDGARDKAALLAHCDRHALPVVTCGAAAGRSDPSRVACRDVALVYGDKLVAACKKELRKNYNFPAGVPFRERQRQKTMQTWSIECVSSTEVVAGDGTERNGALRQCDGALGTACFVTGTFGFVAAAAIVSRIATNTLCAPRGRS